MNFFTAFDVWLQAKLATFVADKTAALAALLEPFAVVCALLYVMVWGYLQLAGKIEEPVFEGARRILVLVAVLGFSIRLWSYNAFWVDTFMTSPQALATALAGAPAGPGLNGTADTVLNEGFTVAENLYKQAGVLDGNFGFYIAAAVMWIVITLTATYAAFLAALSRIALALILALGPLFILGLLFDSTRRFFESWVAQLANYALIAVLTGAIGGLLLEIVTTEATAMSAAGTDLTLGAIVPLVAACVLVLLVMLQIMPIASGLASGVALTSMGVVSKSIAWGGTQSLLFARGATDAQTSRWDPPGRRAGYVAGTPVRMVARKALSSSARTSSTSSRPSTSSGPTLRPRNESRRPDQP